jgi:hypothetical protein
MVCPVFIDDFTPKPNEEVSSLAAILANGSVVNYRHIGFWTVPTGTDDNGYNPLIEIGGEATSAFAPSA